MDINIAVKWVVDNKEWLFSGLGVMVVTILFNKAKKREGAQLSSEFYVLLFVGIIFGMGIDYFFNFDNDIELKIFVFGITIISVFLFNRLWHIIAYKISVYCLVKALSIEDCKYIMKCASGGEKIKLDPSSGPTFDRKWHNIMYVNTGDLVALYEEYEICVCKYAYRLVKKRLEVDTI